MNNALDHGLILLTCEKVLIFVLCNHDNQSREMQLIPVIPLVITVILSPKNALLVSHCWIKHFFTS